MLVRDPGQAFDEISSKLETVLRDADILVARLKTALESINMVQAAF